MPALAIAAGSIGLAACTIEMGPPPESDPPLVAESQRPPPPPPQPTEPQAWSKDLDFDSGGELRIRRQQMAEGLVAADGDRAYSSERLTFESAEDDGRPPSEAELIRERARQRLLEAQSVSAGASAARPAIAPPEVVAAPVEPVNAEALPEQGDENQVQPLETAAPPVETPPTAAEQPDAAAGQVAAQEVDTASAEPPAPAQADPAGQPVEVVQTAAEAAQDADATPVANLAPAEKLTGPPDAPLTEQVAALDLEPWDAPEGTILVQVSAIRDRQQIAPEWERLKQGYPGVFGPLRLVVEEAKLGDRGVFFRVQAGGFTDEKQAEEACLALTGQGQSCFVVERSVGG